MAALRLARAGALAQLARRTRPGAPRRQPRLADRPGQVGLLAFAGDAAPGPTAEWRPPVTTMIKADLKCSSVAAASVLAKVERDAMMVALAADYPEYAWEVNKGYATPRAPRRPRAARAVRAPPAVLAAARGAGAREAATAEDAGWPDEDCHGAGTGAGRGGRGGRVSAESVMAMMGGCRE